MRRYRLNTFENVEHAQNGHAVSSRLLRHAWAYRSHLLTIPLFGVGVALATALAPYLIGRAIDRHIASGNASGLGLTIGLLVVVYAGGMVGRLLQQYQMGWVAQHVLADLRDKMFAAIQRQSLGFYAKHESGDLQSRLVNDVDNINTVFSQGLVQAISGLMTTVGVVIGMVSLSWKLALANVLVVPIMIGATSLFSRQARQAYRASRETIGDVSANLQEDIAGIRVSQAYNRVDVNLERFAQVNRANRNANVKASVITSAFAPTMDLLSVVAIAIVIAYGGYLTIQSEITVGVIVAFLGYVLQFFLPIQQISQLYTSAQSALASAERVFQLIDAPAEIPEPIHPVELPSVEGRVEFEKVCFAYEPDKPVLRGVDLIAEPGQTVALVGPTGAGKTTIVNLVGRFYDVTGGRVSVDGVDVRDLRTGDLRGRMGIVPQNSFLFSDTIMENIRFGRPTATDEEVVQAARLALADEFITRLPRGYQMKVGERGARLSLGQRQLVAIARALLADPRILILDEATSSVDTRTEKLIQRALAQLTRGRTSFVIAHRLSTIQNADQVLVVDHGQIVERGTHQELLAHGGLYAELYERQFRDAPALVSTAES